MEKLQIENEIEIDKSFKKITESFLGYLIYLKNKFDLFDKGNISREKRIQLVKETKEAIFLKLDMYFSKSWEIASTFDRKKFKINQAYYYNTLAPLLELAEINKHIYRKPFGYPGDYIAMNYIYDYNGNNNFLGDTSYEMLINNYTCNLPFSGSNVTRKDFLKNKIIEVINNRPSARILSIGSGPTRELLELLKEEKIEMKFNFTCLDFEDKALNYVKEELNKVKNKTPLNIKYLYKTLVEIIRNKFDKTEITSQDLIYVFGLFDYLKDKFAIMLTKEFYQLLNKNGELIICNASSESNSHRAYYEILGKWNMVYRSREQILNWCKNLNLNPEVEFAKFTERVDYLFLVINKL